MHATTTTPRTIAVTGATGQQGRALVDLLLARGHRVRAVTRDPDGSAARRLATAGADVRRADLDAGTGVAEAFAGADALFLLTTPFERGAAAEVAQAGHAGRAAAAAGVAHVVYSSVTRPMTASPVEHFAAKGEAERVLAALGVRLTVIGAPPFLDNLIAPWHLPWLRRGVFALPVPDDVAMPMVLTLDIAAVAAHVLDDPGAYAGERLDIATEAITGRAILAGLEAATGRAFERRHLSFAELDPVLGRLFAAVELGPPAGAPPSLHDAAARRRLDGIAWSSYAAWVRTLDWPRLLEPDRG